MDHPSNEKLRAKRTAHTFYPLTQICIKCGMAQEYFEASGHPVCTNRFPAEAPANAYYSSQSVE